MDCFARHFGWICVVCENPLPMVTKFDSPGDYPNGNNAPAWGRAPRWSSSSSPLAE